MKVPFTYILRSIWTRRLTTVLTVGGHHLGGKGPNLVDRHFLQNTG